MKTFCFDICKNPSDDILNENAFLSLADLILSGKIGKFHLGVPCRTWSRARVPPLRDLGHLLSGVPGLRARDRQVVEEGNELTRRSVVLLNLACACGVPCSIENPASSLIWRHPKMQQWISDWNISICETHLCQWGRPYKKATTIAACRNYK